jgi:hypothetical protein
MKILLGDFNAKVGREDIFKPIMVTRAYMKPERIRGSETYRLLLIMSHIIRQIEELTVILTTTW